MRSAFKKKLVQTVEDVSNLGSFKKVHIDFFSSLKLNIKHALPKRCRVACCKETTKDRLFHRGFKKLKAEI